MHPRNGTWPITADHLRFAAHALIAMLVAHAIACLAHEYAHSTTA